NPVLRQSKKPSSQKGFIADFFNSPEDQGMMGNDHVRPPADGPLRRLIRHIQAHQDFLDFPVPASQQKSRIIPLFRAGRRIFFFQDLNNFFTLHNMPPLCGYTAATSESPGVWPMPFLPAVPPGTPGFLYRYAPPCPAAAAEPDVCPAEAADRTAAPLPSFSL